MAHPVDRHRIERINSVLLLGLLWAALAACVIGALIHDVILLLRSW
jgi:hypothetical protein